MADDKVDPERLSLSVVRTLRWIILLSVGGIISLSLVGIALAYGLFGADAEAREGALDESISVIGNIASACVGGLVGFLTRDLVLKFDQAGRVVDEGDVVLTELKEREGEEE